MHLRVLTRVGTVKLNCDLQWTYVDAQNYLAQEYHWILPAENYLSNWSHGPYIPIGYPSYLYDMCLGLHSNHLTCSAVYPDMPLIIQDLLSSNPTIIVHQFDITAIKRRLTFRVKSNSEFHNPCYTDEKSIMLPCIRRWLTLPATNPESFTSTLCVWHQATQSLHVLSRPCYIIKLGKCLQHGLCDPSVS